MRQIVECVPNVSEGRDREKINKLVNALTRTPDLSLLDLHSDSDHNRSVFTFVGSLNSIEQGALNLVEAATELIDLTNHTGIHPRMGAVDVIPFVPIQHVSMEACVQISERVAHSIWDRFQIPVYLYELSARSPKRKNLANIRRGGFEGFAEKIKDVDWEPDFGNQEIHPSAGVVAVGARHLLIAYNINLETADLSIAKEIARCIRFSSGGMPEVKALGLFLEDQGIAQVSMNLTNYKITSIHEVFCEVERLAEGRGVGVRSSEIVGLVPHDALPKNAALVLKLQSFSSDQVLEERIKRTISDL